MNRRLLAGVFLAVAACSTGPSATSTHPTRQDVTNVPLSGKPYGVAISRQGEVLVTLLNLNEVLRGSLDNLSLGAPIAVGAVPPHVAFDRAGHVAYVVNQTGQSLMKVDPDLGTALDTVSLTADGMNLIVSRDGAQVFVSVATGQVYVVNASSFQIIDSIILGPVVNGFALHPTKSLVYISSRDGQTVSEVSVASHQVLRTFPTGGMPQRLAVSPDGTDLLIANETLGLDIWNLPSGQRDTTLTSVPAYGLGLSPDGEEAYVAGAQGDITVVNCRTRQIVTTISTGGIPRNVAFSRAGDVALVTNESGFVTVIR